MFLILSCLGIREFPMGTGNLSTPANSFVDDSSGVQKAMDMGILFDSLSGNGFMAKQRRSESTNKNENSYFRYSARFRRIPALEIEDSD